MKICVAQTKPVTGDVRRNIDAHKKLIDLAASAGANTIIFPELSLTGYEPRLARELATDENDVRFDDFQRIADSARMTIGVGVPTKGDGGVHISAIIFQPHEPRRTYSKRYLHEDEKPFFIGGRGSDDSIGGEEARVALAICYELSVPEHAADAHDGGAKIYAASVAKSADGVDKAARRLSEIASEYSMTVLMSNCTGRCDDFESAGGSAIWNYQGELLGRLNDADEGVLMIDTETREVTARTIPR